MQGVSEPMLTGVRHGRREFVGSLTAALAWPSALVKAQAEPFRLTSPGCCITSSEFGAVAGGRRTSSNYGNGSDAVIARSGNAAFDAALAKSLSRISHVFGVLPGFGYYDDANEGPLGNAKASQEVRLGREDGTVLFGQGLLQQHASQPNGDAAILAVCAHEFAHIVQYKYQLQSRLVAANGAVKLLELHADYLAGYFGAVRRHENPNFAAVEFAYMMKSFGDYSQSVEHHGTPDERTAAIEAGAGAFKVKGLGFQDAVSEGVVYVETL